MNKFDARETGNREGAPEIRREAYSVAEFCTAHRISRAFFYKLAADGKGPSVMKVGNRTLIARDAAEQWRKAMEVSR